jgi:hypothetical protein
MSDHDRPSIGGLEGIARLILNDEFYEIFCILNILLAVVLSFYLFRHPLPFGRFYRPGTSKLGFEVSDLVAVIFTNSSTLISFEYVTGFFSGFDPHSFSCQFFFVIHLYRATFYAWLRSKRSNVWPLETVLYISVCNLLKGALAARALSNETEFLLNTSSSLFLGPIMVLLAIVQAVIDYQLVRLRRPSDREYKIPTGFPFTYISCPSYSLEIVIWLLWGLSFTLNFGTIAIWVWLIPHVYVRAETTHRWYLRTFKGQYPRARNSLLPFNVGRLLGGAEERP